MSYALREAIPECFYHAVTRGNNRRAIFTDELTRLMFMTRLTITARRCGWTIVAYTLMDNHYHLVLRIGDSGLSAGMKQLNGLYAMAFNDRVGRRDHLFGRRFWSRRIEDDADLVETCRYVDLNRSRLELEPCHPSDWRWSGYRAAVGLEPAAPVHQPHELWRCFDRQPRLAMDAYAAFVEDGLIGTGLTRTRPVSDTAVRAPGEPAGPAT